jgi:AraC-like DNA-binding protein
MKPAGNGWMRLTLDKQRDGCRIFTTNHTDMQHVEFFDREHFEFNYHRKTAKTGLDAYIDFFWETDFYHIWDDKPEFTDVLFPNVGYTYMVNLGSPFRIQLDQDLPYTIKSDAFIPRYRNISTHHTAGNKIFGIKFTISPVVLEKNVDFSEYMHAPTSLAYLIPQDVLRGIRAAIDFRERVRVVEGYYSQLIDRYQELSTAARIVRESLSWVKKSGNWNISVSDIAANYGVDVRTLQRYFECTTSISTKQALQMIRIRTAIAALIDDPNNFDCKTYGFYDTSHFYKQMNGFFEKHPAFEKEKYLPQLHSSPVKIRY